MLGDINEYPDSRTLTGPPPLLHVESKEEARISIDSMTAVGFPSAQESDCRVSRGVAKEKLKPLLVVSANSLDAVERIRQTPSDESVSRSFAEVVGLMIGAVKGVFGVLFSS